HVAKRAGFLVIRPAALHAHRFGRRNLNVADVAAVPQRLEDAVAEPERQNILDGLLPEVMIYAVNVALGKYTLNIGVQSAGCSQVVTKGLLHDDAPPAVSLLQSGLTEALHHGAVITRLCRKIEKNIAADAVGFFQFRELFTYPLI